MNELARKLQEIFGDIFDDDSLVLQPEMTSSDIDGWDSLAHINLIVALEKKFGIKFTTAEISATKEPGQNVGALMALIEKKIGC